MTSWSLYRLTEQDCANLAPHVSEAARRDLAASDYSPETALGSAMREGGEAWAVCGDARDHVLGAFGWTDAGAIWSMWRPLSQDEQAEALRWAPLFIQAMVRDAGGRRLGNVVWEGSRGIIRWLRETGCFDFFVDRGLSYGDRVFIPFATKPQLETSPHV